MANQSLTPIYLVPFEYIESSLLNYLVNELNEFFRVNIVIENKQPLPPASYNQYRNQYRATAFLQALQNLHKQEKTVGICNVDIYASNLDFVFSIAEPSAQVAIVSLTRLRPIYYKMYQDEGVFWMRVLKEIFHALGRIYGLEHCYRQECVMSGSSSIMDIDIKSDRFCGDCRRLIRAAIEKENPITDEKKNS